MAKIADFAYFEPLWSLYASFAGHPVFAKCVVYSLVLPVKV